MIWQVPPPELSFHSAHYKKFWAAAEELAMPVSMHILTGAPYRPGFAKGTKNFTATEFTHFAVTTNCNVSSALTDLIVSGVLEANCGRKLPQLELFWLTRQDQGFENGRRADEKCA